MAEIAALQGMFVGVAALPTRSMVQYDCATVIFKV